MKVWVDLYEQHQRLRQSDDEELHGLRKQLLALAERGHCDKTVQGRFSAKKNGERRKWSLTGLDGRESEPLTGLSALKDARLTVLAQSHARTRHLSQFTVIVEGTTQEDRPWLVGVHLEEDGERGDQKASGACGHAALHCHVGPSFDALPKVRVPLPALGPQAILDWVLATVVDGWEPAPWAAVNELLEHRRRSNT